MCCICPGTAGRGSFCSAAWEPITNAVVTAATAGHTPAELADTLDQLGTTTHCTPLAGNRDREQLRAGLDDVDTEILTATLDRLNP